MSSTPQCLATGDYTQGSTGTGAPTQQVQVGQALPTVSGSLPAVGTYVVAVIWYLAFTNVASEPGAPSGGGGGTWVRLGGGAFPADGTSGNTAAFVVYGMEVTTAWNTPAANCFSVITVSPSQAALARVQCLVFDRVVAIDGFGYTNHDTTSGTPPVCALPSLTSTNKSDKLLGMWLQLGEKNLAGAGLAVPTGYTSRYNADGVFSVYHGYGLIGDEDFTTPGATPTSSVDFTKGGAQPISFFSTQIGIALLLAAYTAPYAPTLIGPSGQGVNVSTPITFTATYNSSDGSTGNGYEFRIKTATGAYQYWNATSGALQSTPVVNTISSPVADQGTISVTLPANTLTLLQTYSWSIAAQESGANILGAFATDATVTTAPAPTMSGLAPSGTITTTDRPALTWTATAASGETITAWRVVWEIGSYGTTPGTGTTVEDTGVQLGNPGYAQPAEALTNHTAYRQFVQVEQTDSQWSAWYYADITLNLTLPTTPTLTGTSGTDTQAPQADLTVAGHASGPYTATNTTLQVQTSVDGGTTWADVRNATALTPNPSTFIATVSDYEAPAGAVLYRARAVGLVDGVNTVNSAWTAPITVDVAGTGYWLMDPLDPDTTALPVQITTDSDRKASILQDITVTLGSPEPVIESDVRQLQTGQSIWLTRNPTERAALLALLNSGAVLLQRMPSELDADCGVQPGDSYYFVPTGDITISRVGARRGKNMSERLVTTAWAERSRP